MILLLFLPLFLLLQRAHHGDTQLSLFIGDPVKGLALQRLVQYFRTRIPNLFLDVLVILSLDQTGDLGMFMIST